MSRLVATMVCDVRVQFRNGFYYAAGFVALYMTLLLQWPRHADLAWILPAAVFGNLMINTFYFLAGLLLLEKREGTLEAQIVTPLRRWEYLASKLITLTALTVLENLAIVAVAYGLDLRFLPLVAGLVLGSAIYALFGFALVARYDSINEFLMPSFLAAAVLSIPLLPYFGFAEGWWHYLHPLLGTLLLLKAGFAPVPSADLVYAVAWSLLWVAAAFWWSRRVFLRFVVTGEGSD